MLVLVSIISFPVVDVHKNVLFAFVLPPVIFTNVPEADFPVA